MKKLVMLSLLVVTMSAEFAMAGRGRGPGRHGGYHGGPRGSSDYGDGVVAGILLSTSALFLSDVTANSSAAVYVNADQDAATFLAEGEGAEPTPALAQAMQYERNFLASAQVQNAEALSDQDVAYLVMKRAESL